ncbi:zinc-dependent alcohol dehydrogenase [Agaribacter flavus]|uniref:Zinc-binding alcohol dehydrogenase n=1 Tax=Agaribacter flavus TaxID=1902781 RepID=A0ABV7FNZ6_9ALTE
MSNLALWHVDNTKSELREVDTAKLDSELIQVNSLFSLVSSGTEKLVATGNVNKKLVDKMSVPYMQGSFSLPIKYGYSLVGKTQDNALVHVLHPHQQIAYVNKADVFPLPADIPAKRLSLLSNMETIVNAIWDSEHLLTLSNKDLPIAICGFGNIGALLACTLKQIALKNITIIETDEWRASKAAALGFKVSSPLIKNQQYTLIYHTTCTQEGIQWSLQSACFEGTIVELSWYASEAVELVLGEHFHYNRLRIISSQVSNIPGHKPDETYASRKKLAINFLRDPIYDSLFAEDIELKDAPDFFNHLRNQTLPKGLIWCIRYPNINP